MPEEGNEFVFIGDRAVSLRQPGAAVSVHDRFDLQTLQRKLPGYVVEFVGGMEGKDAFEVSRGDTPFLHIRGVLNSRQIVNIMDAEGVIDATGAATYDPISAAYETQIAECTLALVYYASFCRSEHSPAIWYVVIWNADCPVEFHDFFQTGRKTPLLDCMMIAGLEIVPSNATAR